MSRPFSEDFPALGRREKKSIDIDLLSIDRRRRTRRACTVQAVLSAAFSAYFFWAGAPQVAVAVGALGLVGVGLLIYLRRGGNSTIAGTIALAAMYLGLSGALLLAGSFYRPGFAWLYLVPLAAGVLLGQANVFRWTVVVMVTAVGFWVLHTYGVRPPAPLPDGAFAVSALLMRLAAIGCAGLLVHMFVRAHARAHVDAAEANRGLRRQQARLQMLALYDRLTGLPNRPSFERVVGRALDAHGEEVALLFVDVDGFRDLNHARGKEAGDLVLKAVGERIEQTIFEGNDEPEPSELDEGYVGALAGRWGADEFSILLCGPAARTASRVASELQTVLGRPIVTRDGDLIRLSVTIGVSSAADDDVASLVAHADAALVRAKRLSTDGIGYFDAEDYEVQRRERVLRAGLEGVVERGELELAYQPLFHIDGRIIGAEALLRWNSPVLGAVSPGEFIPVAESSGQVVKLGAWVLQEACAQASEWPSTMRISVNVSPLQLMHPRFVQKVASVLEFTGLDPQRLELEVTEGVLAKDIDGTVELLEGLRALGVSIALDDFGTGYSSLAYLRRLPVERLKIDRSFVQSMHQDEGDMVLVRTIIAMGHGLGMIVLAEGVETQAQFESLESLGCDEIQGYLLGRPLDLDGIEVVLAQARGLSTGPIARTPEAIDQDLAAMRDEALRVGAAED